MRLFDIMVGGTVILLILLSINFQPYFSDNNRVDNQRIIAVDHALMIMKYTDDGGGCTNDLNLNLDFLELNSTTIFFRWEHTTSDEMLCGYDIDVLISSKETWLTNLTIVLDNKKVIENVNVIKSSNSMVSMNEYKPLFISYLVSDIIVIFSLSVI